MYGCEIILQGKEGSIHHEDLGKSIATVQVLQRKHETFEREVTALGNKVHVCGYTHPLSLLYMCTYMVCHDALPNKYMCMCTLIGYTTCMYSPYLKNVIFNASLPRRSSGDISCSVHVMGLIENQSGQTH